MRHLNIFYSIGNTAQSPPDGFALNLLTYSAQVLCGVAYIVIIQKRKLKVNHIFKAVCRYQKKMEAERYIIAVKSTGFS